MRIRQYAAETTSGIADNLERQDRRAGTSLLLAAALGLSLALVYWVIVLVQAPSFDDVRRVRTNRPSVILAAGGEPIAHLGEDHQRWMPLDRVAPAVIQGLVATEDHRFFDHWGVDIRRLGGSILQTVRGDRQGGSTITMQLARNAFPDLNDNTPITRKIKEWITALRLEAVYDKSEILELYLNTVPFMYNTAGIEAAAETYFRKTASALQPEEAATLVGMLKGTSYYNPVRHPNRSHERRNVVLQQMVAHGFLEDDAFRALENVPTRLRFRRPSRADDLAPHFSAHVRGMLRDWTDEHGMVAETGGLVVHTTLDLRLQRAAQDAVAAVTDQLQAVADVEWSSEGLLLESPNAADYAAYRGRATPFAYFWESHADLVAALVKDSDRFEKLVADGTPEAAAQRTLLSDPPFVDSLKSARQAVEAGFVAIHPQTGHVVAWVGGRDFERNQYDHVATAERQPGSTFKPFVYAAALENGYTPDDRRRDEVLEYTDAQTNRTWSPENVDGASGQMMTLRDALAYSKNTITAQVIADVGPAQVIDVARRLGIRSDLDPYLSLGLGTSEVTLLELTSAYAAIANDGAYRAPLIITHITDADGRELVRFESEERRALDPETANRLHDMLRTVVDYGTGVRIRNEFGTDGDVAAKTGTSQDGADGWFILMQPQLVAGAWVGFDMPAITFRSGYWGQGAHTALPIVGMFDREARSGAPLDEVEDPAARLATEMPEHATFE